KLTAPATINRLGISSEDVQSLLSHVRTLQPVPESLADATTFYRDKIGIANGYTSPEMKYRDGLGLISATDSNIQTILDEMMKSGELRKGMSEKEIAKAVTTYVQTNFEYIADGVKVEGKSGDHWNSISETIAAKGGDCEDLSVVLASLMMGALSRSGYSDAEIHQKVTIAAGYVVNKAGAAKGHATVKLDLDDGSALALDATSDKAPFSFDWLKMDVVLEGNDQVFKQYGAIDALFETAAEAQYFDVEGTIHSINEKLVELKDMLAAPVEVPLASSDGKSYTYYDTVTQTNKDISQHPGWDGSKVDFGFYTLEKKRVEDFGGTWHSDMFVTYFNEDKFFEFMSESRDLINRAVMLFHVVNMNLEYDEHQASEIAVSGFEEHEKAELLETMDSTQKFKNRFVNAMNNSLTKISSGIESVVNEMFIFVSGNNNSQEARVRAEIQAYGREDVATGILSALADELSGAFSFVRATAGLELSGIMSEINLANAQAYARYVKDFSENIALWDVNHLTEDQRAGQTNTNSFYNFGDAAVSNMQGFSTKNNKQALQNILDRGLDQLDALSGNFNDRTSSFSAKVGVSVKDTNATTASVENNAKREYPRPLSAFSLMASGRRSMLFGVISTSGLRHGRSQDWLCGNQANRAHSLRARHGERDFPVHKAFRIQ
ncbi:hypothetical protein EBR57_08195, partial [bacterium]|nr:hypothetical protein [bacterium]